MTCATLNISDLSHRCSISMTLVFLNLENKLFQWNLSYYYGEIPFLKEFVKELICQFNKVYISKRSLTSLGILEC